MKIPINMGRANALNGRNKARIFFLYTIEYSSGADGTNILADGSLYVPAIKMRSIENHAAHHFFIKYIPGSLSTSSCGFT